MTAEEMAEEWVKSQMVHCIQEQVPYFDFAMQAYLAGLKAGKTKWHKVADGDLPPVETGNERRAGYSSWLSYSS